VTGAGFLAVVLGAAATKITHSELLSSRREAARDRAEQAQAYRELDVRRSAEGVEFAADMQGLLAKRDATVSRLERRLTDAAAELAEARRDLTEAQERTELAEREADRLGSRLADADERATAAVVRVAELEQEIDVLTTQWQAAEAALAEQLSIRKGA
jgi:chromosome segregation ATPase